jgi:hypothetical protein
VREARGSGAVDFQHRFCTAGFNTVTVKITDSGGRATEARRLIFVNAPGSAAVGGRGTLSAAAGAAGVGAGPLRFALWAPVGGQTARAGGKPGAGAPFVRLSGPFQFQAETLEGATRSGPAGRLEGMGRYNGRPGYRFLIEAVDGGEGNRAGTDTLRVRIAHQDARGKETVDYDNGTPARMKAPVGASSQNRTALAEGGLRLSE